MKTLKRLLASFDAVAAAAEANSRFKLSGATAHNLQFEHFFTQFYLDKSGTLH